MSPIVSVMSASGARGRVPAPPVSGGGGGGGSFAANLPAGTTLIGDTSFETGMPAGLNGGIGGTNLSLTNWVGTAAESPANFSVSLVPSTGGHGSQALRARHPGNDAGNGVGPLTIGTSDIDSRALYVAARLRYSDDYVFHTNGEKLVLPMAYQPGDNAALINVGPNGVLQAVVGTMGTLPPPLGETVTGPVVPRGQWFTFEYYTRYNTPGNSDGLQQVWIDGSIVLNRQSLNLVANPTQVLFRLGRLDFTRGGGASSVLTPAGGQWVDLDRVAIYSGS